MLILRGGGKATLEHFIGLAVFRSFSLLVFQAFGFRVLIREASQDEDFGAVKSTDLDKNGLGFVGMDSVGMAVVYDMLCWAVAESAAAGAML
jgi:hypothetical protein